LGSREIFILASPTKVSLSIPERARDPAGFAKEHGDYRFVMLPDDHRVTLAGENLIDLAEKDVPRKIGPRKQKGTAPTVP
jgi:hypothetical protein